MTQIQALIMEIQQMRDTHPESKYDEGWNLALENCVDTIMDFFGEKDETPDEVNHPAHYCDGGIETLDFILAKKLDSLLGQVCKYISRAGKKDQTKELQDLEKAEFYLKRKIELLKEAGANEV